MSNSKSRANKRKREAEAAAIRAKETRARLTTWAVAIVVLVVSGLIIQGVTGHKSKTADPRPARTVTVAKQDGTRYCTKQPLYKPSIKTDRDGNIIVDVSSLK